VHFCNRYYINYWQTNVFSIFNSAENWTVLIFGMFCDLFPMLNTTTRVARWHVFKNPNLGKFWRVLQWKMLAYFLPFGIFCGFYWSFGNFPLFWYAPPKEIWQP
jgi:hypothetical protein